MLGGAGDLLFPLPCQRPEGTLAGESRSSSRSSCSSSTADQAGYQLTLWKEEPLARDTALSPN
jgi:hypothetical protein